MIGNYWNSALRNLMKRKVFSFINISVWLWVWLQLYLFLRM